MSLKIRFINKTDYEPGLARGEITLHEFVEEFESSLALWNAERYERQWQEGIERLRHGAASSCLITSVWASPRDSDCDVFGVWWKLYRVGERVVVQNQLLLSSVFGREFDPDDPYRSIPERRSVNAEGVQVSEWTVEFDSIGCD